SGPPPSCTLLPCTTLFRSNSVENALNWRRIIPRKEGRCLVMDQRPRAKQPAGATIVRSVCQCVRGRQIAAIAQEQFTFGLIHIRSEEHTSELQSREKLVCR